MRYRKWIWLSGYRKCERPGFFRAMEGDCNSVIKTHPHFSPQRAQLGYDNFFFTTPKTMQSHATFVLK